jgi:Ni,Fe-hydrogenase III small subunit
MISLLSVNGMFVVLVSVSVTVADVVGGGCNGCDGDVLDATTSC